VTLRHVDGGLMIERAHGSRLAAWLATVREAEPEVE
jgi:hypothetical protein